MMRVYYKLYSVSMSLFYPLKPAFQLGLAHQDGILILAPILMHRSCVASDVDSPTPKYIHCNMHHKT